ncbi:MAG TPA: hypothetical protein VHB21_02115 [Minicystis sp.]|nr:hypothetical protein [Minicystis sp.]
MLRLAWVGVGLVGVTFLGAACTAAGPDDPGSDTDPIVTEPGHMAGGKHHHHVQCGDTTCGADEICCSESCSICGPKGGVCPDVACAPQGVPCGDTTCGPNEICCSDSCGVCGPKGGVCPDIACAPQGVPCGDTTCGPNEICCSDSCGICGPKGGVCPDVACAP